MIISFNLFKKKHWYIMSKNIENALLDSIPKCMFERQPLTSAPSLTIEQVEKAKDVLVNKDYVKLEFPRVIRLRVDPDLPQQKYCAFTFTPSRNATPDKDGVYGIIKFRGSFMSEQEAEERCSWIIQNVDSYNENLIGYVGRDFPLSVQSKFVRDTKEIDVRMKMDSIAKDNIKKQREEEKKEMDEIQQRQKQLLADTTEHKDTSFDDLDYYTTLRTKRASLRMFQEECEKKLKEAGKSIKQTGEEINKLDESHPEYKKQYEEKYKQALSAVNAPMNEGTPAYKMIQYMK